MDVLSRFKQCLIEESEAIKKTTDYFGDEIIRAVDIIFHTKGKVIITGVGKSGHVGKKIAASLSSMGTPAFFVHATEGVHGDLGMIQKDDVVLLLSNSGETIEVLNLLPSLKVIGVKKIAITKSHDSTLAKAVDVSLAYHYDQEADHLHLAPTISSTLTLAIGDALAVTLSEMRQFTKENFHLYHPGGSLGKALKKQ